MSIDREQQVLRLQEAKISMPDDELEMYIEAPDILSEELVKADIIPTGYKRCGRCKQVKKLYLFNRNASSRINCTGNCKSCQSATAQDSYDKNKGNRDYKKYYAENRDKKRKHNREYYARHKEELAKKHRAYRQTDEGKKAMNQAHSTRKKSLKQNAGIPYTREIVIDRDSVFINEEFPVCCLCGQPITEVNDIHMEHLVPIVIGGVDCFTNVGCAHSECNLRKSKDAQELTVEQVSTIEQRAEKYIDAHPEHFPDFK
jgi:hypothetical protein